MNALAMPWSVLPATQPEALKAIEAFEAFTLEHCAQIELEFDHVLHGGMYSRTLCMEPGTVITGALMKMPTMLIACGHMEMLAGTEWVELSGYNVMPAAAGRKQVFKALSRSWLTMVFPTKAATVEEAEAEFTDQHEQLSSRRSAHNTVRVTGE